MARCWHLHCSFKFGRIDFILGCPLASQRCDGRGPCPKRRQIIGYCISSEGGLAFSLARLMIQHEVGVRARKTYVLRSVDEDYFTDF